MSRIAYLLTFLFWFKPAWGVNLGPINNVTKFCEDFQKVGSILQAFQMTQYPVVGIGVAVGVSIRSNPVVDFCQYMFAMKSATTAEAIFLTAEYLNKVTEKGMNDEINLARDTFNLANSLYDFENGKSRSSSMDVVYVAERLGNYVGKVQGYNERRKAKQEALKERQRIMELAATSKNISVLKEMMKCPKPTNKDYNKIYAEKIKPIQENVDYFKQEVDFYVSQLITMAGESFKSHEKFVEFQNDLKNMEVSFVAWKTIQKFKNEEELEKTKEKNPDGSYKTEKKIKKVPYYEYNPIVNSGKFGRINKYSAYWSSYVSNKFDYVKEFNYGNDTKAKEYFAKFDVQCAPHILAGRRSVSTNPDDMMMLEKREKECQQANNKTTQKRAENLFEGYVEDLRMSFTRYIMALAKFYSAESEYLGVHRYIPNPEEAELISSNGACVNDMSMADMQKLLLKAQSESAKASAIIAEETYKISLIEQQKIEESRKFYQEQARKRQAEAVASERAAQDRKKEEIKNLKLMAPK